MRPGIETHVDTHAAVRRTLRQPPARWTGIAGAQKNNARPTADASASLCGESSRRALHPLYKRKLHREHPAPRRGTGAARPPARIQVPKQAAAALLTRSAGCWYMSGTVHTRRPARAPAAM
jgi:hypothetical protein